MKQYRTREGDVSAVDTRTALSTTGSETAPGPLLVPQLAKYIIGVIVTHITDMAAATGYSAFIRLEGPGLAGGPQTLAIGAGGQAVATGGNANNEAKFIPLNLEVTSAQEIQIFAEMAGTDVGTMTVGVSLVFSDTLPAGESINQTFTVEGDITAIDTRTSITTQGSVTAPSPVTPAQARKIRRIVCAATAEGLADGSQVIFLRLGGNAIRGGEQVLMVGASGRKAVQAGSDAAPQLSVPTILDNLDIDVSPSDTITLFADSGGADTGTVHIVATVVYE